MREWDSIPDIDKYNTLGIPEDLEETRKLVEPMIDEQKKTLMKNYTFKILLNNFKRKRAGPISLIILYIFAFGSCTSSKDSIYVVQIITDSLFNSHQRINLLTLNKESLNGYSIDFAYHEDDLKTTSQIAEKYGAVAAINGSFFDVDSGGSVTYFEIDDSVISRTRHSELKWAVPD
ncbi:hypothetical protein KA005_61920, partial [bacterium]|nr:hypothetical protein [bacterium]